MKTVRMNMCDPPYPVRGPRGHYTLVCAHKEDEEQNRIACDGSAITIGGGIGLNLLCTCSCHKDAAPA